MRFLEHFSKICGTFYPEFVKARYDYQTLKRIRISKCIRIIDMN